MHIYAPQQLRWAISLAFHFCWCWFCVCCGLFTGKIKFSPKKWKGREFELSFIFRGAARSRPLNVMPCHPHTRFQVVAPHGIRRKIFEALHASPQACHLGGTRTYNQITRHLYWPDCSSAIRRWCLECVPCARAKPGTGKGRAPLHQDSVSAPMERTAIDILGPLPETEDGNEYILVACDYFTKWVQVWPLPDHRAPTVARALMTDLFLPFGVPTQLHSDQGREFESRLISELCRAYEINKTRTTPYTGLKVMA